MNDHEYTEKLKKHHMCIRCKKQDAYTLNGRAMCFDCAEYYRERSITNYKQKREKILFDAAMKRQECVSKNICVVCLKRKTDGIHKICLVCRERRNAKRRAKTTYIPGLVCYHCHKPLDGQIKSDGKPSKLCSNCYNKTVRLAMENVKRKVENKRINLR